MSVSYPRLRNVVKAYDGKTNAVDDITRIWRARNDSNVRPPDS